MNAAHNMDDPELTLKCPPKVVPKQWVDLVSYWRSDDAKEEAKRNSLNREHHGPIHTTGRTSFAEMRYEMVESGEATDKMSVWIKAHSKNDPDVIQSIKDYNNLLSMEPEDQRELVEVKDRIFHRIFGVDGHSLCRTYGTDAPRSLVYPSEPPPPNITSDLVQKITEEVTQKVTEKVTKEVTEKVTKEVTEKVTQEVTEKVTQEVTGKVTQEVTRTLKKEFAMQFAQISDRLSFLESIDGISANSHTQNASVHQREQMESVGDEYEAHVLLLEDEGMATKDGASK